MKYLNSRDLQALNTRKKIMVVSNKLAKEKGFKNVSINNICKEADISVGAFYHHFKNKEEVIAAWFDLSDDYYESEVIPIFEDRIKNKELVFDLVIKYFDFLTEYTIDVGVDIVKEVIRSRLRQDNKEFLLFNRAIPKGLLMLINYGQDSGQLRNDYEPNNIVNELLFIFRGIVLNWCYSENSFDLNFFNRETIKKYLEYYIES